MKMRHALSASDLATDLKSDNLEIYYQPQVDILNPWPIITGYEALIRWPQDDGTIVPPSEFITLAETSGLMAELDMWVIETVCSELAWMQQKGPARKISLSANVNPQLFKQKDMAASVDALLTRLAVDPSRLTLEITETAVLDQDQTTFQNIHALHEIGVTLSLDDFGIGYSSLLHLRELPIKEIKLDRTFVFGILNHERDALIAEAMIELASGLGLRIVAEGVEQTCQVDWLRARGCQSIQGFLYGLPAPRRHAISGKSPT